MRRSTFRIAAALLAIAALAAGCDLFFPSKASASSIASFAIARGDNPSLPSDAIGSIDAATRTITVWMDGSVSDFTALKPTIAVSGGAAVYPASGEAKDFSQTPVTYKLVETDGTTIVYYVIIATKPVAAAAGAVRITEYFCGTGTGTATTGELNRYLELYNGSDAVVDLAQYELVQKRSRNGVPDASLDQRVRLKGSIAAKSFYLIYSARINTSLLANAAAFGARQSDAVYNGVLDSDGASAYRLLKDGAEIDAVGPNDGSLYAKETCFYRRSVTSTGLPGPAASVWDSSSWASAPASGLLGDDANAGIATPTSAAIISLLVSDGTLSIPATVDNAARIGTILLPDGVDSAALAVSVGTFGLYSAIDGQTIRNGVTKVDFSSGTKTLRITGQDGSATDYTISAIPRYTTVNYDFDGGILAVVNAIKAGGSNDTNLGGAAITGVVTAKSIYPKAFVIQDRNAGIYFYTSEDIAFPVGSKVRITVNTGKVYFGLPEVTAYDSAIEAAGSSLYSIYYKTGDYSDPDVDPNALGSVYRYQGNIAQGGLSYYKGQFADKLYFHYPTEIQSLLSAGTSGTFYGPISFTRDNYTMELVTRDQFSLE